MRHDDDQSRGLTNGVFPTTHWCVVNAAGTRDSEEADVALAKLCSCYWHPVYSYVRCQGHDAHNAQDLTQAFFERLIERDLLALANEDKGRFRSFLLTLLKRFLVNDWVRSRAKKRGGGRETLSIDTTAAEERYKLEPVHNMTADRMYDRRWALAVLDAAMDDLRREFTEQGSAELFEHLRGFLYGEGGEVSQSEIAERFDLSGSAVKSTVHRLRQRFRQLLRDQVAQTVACRTDVEMELQHLLEALRG